MKQPIILLLCLFVITHAVAQPAKHASHKTRIRNVIYSTPVSKNTRINGIALGLAARPWGTEDSLEVNGLNIELNPLLPVAGISAILSTPMAPFKPGNNELFNCDSFPTASIKKWSRADGVTISTSIMEEAIIRGVSINAVVSFANKSEGVELTGIMNLHYRFNGICFALLRNKSTTGKGVQIALFNNCREGRFLQIGLINKAGNRILPFFNLRLDDSGFNLAPGDEPGPIFRSGNKDKKHRVKTR